MHISKNSPLMDDLIFIDSDSMTSELGYKRKESKFEKNPKKSKKLSVDPYKNNFQELTITTPAGKLVQIEKHKEKVEFNKRTFNENTQSIIDEMRLNIHRKSLNKSILFSVNKKETENILWADKYQPQCFIDLLSDELSNRLLLKWMKLWEYSVFKKPIKPQLISNYEISRDIEKNIVLDQNNLPKQKAVIISGVSGSGKSSMARIISKHSGYQELVVHLGYECSVQVIKEAISHASGNNKRLDGSSTPICLVFEEVESAPKSCIEFIVSYLNSKNRIKRPFIFITENLYESNLKSLREISLPIHLQIINPHKLNTRLGYILKNENITYDHQMLVNLTSDFNGDIRRLVNKIQVLMCFEYKKGDLDDINSTTLTNNYFETIDAIFCVKKLFTNSTISKFLSVQSFLKHINNFDSFINGIFQNYLTAGKNATNIRQISACSSYFEFSSIFNNFIETNKNYSLTTYLSLLPIFISINCSNYRNHKILFPKPIFECQATQKQHLNDVKNSYTHNKNDPIQTSSIKEFFLSIYPYMTYILEFYSNSHTSLCSKALPSSSICSNLYSYGIYIECRYEPSASNYTHTLVPNLISISKFSKYLSDSYFATNFLRTIKNEMGKLMHNPKTASYTQNTYFVSKKDVVKPKTIIKKDFFGRPIPEKNIQSPTSDTKNEINKPKLVYKYHEGVTDCIKRDTKIAWLVAFLS